MIELKLKRIFKAETYTIGQLYINGEYFCDTIEDTVRQLPEHCPNTCKGLDCKCKEKVYAKTAISTGTYKIVMTMSNRFKRVLPLLVDVPHFIGIRIHKGNTAEDSSGCIILGENKIKGKVINSTFYENKLVELLKNEKDIIIVIE